MAMHRQPATGAARMLSLSGVAAGQLSNPSGPFRALMETRPCEMRPEEALQAAARTFSCVKSGLELNGWRLCRRAISAERSVQEKAMPGSKAGVS